MFKQFQNVTFVAEPPVDVVVVDQVGFSNIMNNNEHQVEHQNNIEGSDEQPDITTRVEQSVVVGQGPGVALPAAPRGPPRPPLGLVVEQHEQHLG